MYRKWLPPLFAALFVIGTVMAISNGTYRYWAHHRAAQLKVGCAAAMKAKDWQTLESLATEWLSLDSDSGNGLLYLGEAAQRRENFELTAKCLASLRDDDPKCVGALTELVELQLAKLNRPLDAVETCQRILRIAPGTCVAHKRLIFFYAMTLQYQKMDEQILASLKAGCVSTDMLIYHFGGSSMRFSNGYDITSHWREDQPNSELFEVAQSIHLSKQASGGEISETERISDLAISLCVEKYPGNLEVLAHQLDGSISDGDLDGIARVLSEAPATAEQDKRFWRAKGWLHQAQGDFELAKEAYETALRYSPYDWRARHRYAGVLRQLGEDQDIEAIADLALEGKLLERVLFELPSTAELPAELRIRLTEHARHVGDEEFATRVDAIYQ